MVEGYYAELGVATGKEYYIIQNNSIAGIFEKEKDNKTFSDYLVDPETVCQYTGKRDINNIRIFENFIVKEKCRNYIGIIKFGEHEKGYGYYINGYLKKQCIIEKILYIGKNMKVLRLLEIFLITQNCYR